jgi:hypothetical protein
VVRVEAFNLPYNFRLAGVVHFTDVIVTGFMDDGDGIHLLKMTAHNFAGCMRSANRNIYD